MIYRYTSLFASLVLIALASCTDPSSEPTPSILQVSFSGDTLSSLRGSTDPTCRVTADWTKCPDSDFGRYILFRSEFPGIAHDPSVVSKLGVFEAWGDTLFLDTDVSWGETWHYAVQTENSSELDCWSNEVSIVLPGEELEPITLSAESDSLSVHLKWTASSSPYFLSNTLYRSETGQISSDTASAMFMGTFGEATDTTFTDTSVFPRTQYYYAILTRTLLGQTIWSDEVLTTFYGQPAFPYMIIDHITAMSFASDIIISSTGDYGMRTQSSYFPNIVISMDDHEAIYELETPTFISNACPLPGGNLVYLSSTSDDVIWVADLDMIALVDSVQMTVVPAAICADPSGGLAYAASYYDHIVSVIDTDSHEVIDWVYTSSNVDGIACHPSGEYVYAISSTGDNVSVIRTSDLEVIAEVEVGNRPIEICCHPDGSSVYVLCYGNSRIYEIDCNTNMIIDSWDCSGSPAGMCILPSGDYLYLSDNWSGNVTIHETTGNSPIMFLSIGSSASALAASPDGQEVLVNNSYTVVFLGL